MSGNQEPEKDPETWPGFFWRWLVYILGRPTLVVVSIILLPFLAYFIARMYAVDPLEPIVELVATKLLLPAGRPAETAGRPPDISGYWEYRTVRRGKLQDGPQAWGGYASIQLTKEKFGWVIKITGERTWSSSNVNSNDRNNLSPPVAWETDGGVFVSDERIQWHYFTHPGPTSEGFTQVDMHEMNGWVDRMEGHYSELHKQDPNYGSFEFTRRLR